MSNRLDDELGRTLRQQAESLPETAISLETVRGTARRIRRRRTVTTAVVAAAAVVALGVPTATVVPDLLHRSDAPAPAEPVQAPRLAYHAPSTTGNAADATFHGADGRVEDGFVNAEMLSMVELSDGRFLTLATQDASSMGPVGAITGISNAASYQAWNNELVPNADHSAVAWLGADGAPMILEAGSDEAIRLASVPGAGRGAEVLALTGSDCSTTDVTEDGCSVWVQVDEGVTYLVSTHNGQNADAVDRWGAVADVSPDGRHYLASSPGPTNEVCVEVRDRDQEGGEAVPQRGARTCDYISYEYSPDGTLVLAHTSMEGLGPWDVVVLDAETLEPVTRLTNQRAAYLQVEWEPPANAGEEWSLLMRVGRAAGGDPRAAVPVRRLHLDGSVEDLGLRSDRLGQS